MAYYIIYKCTKCKQYVRGELTLEVIDHVKGTHTRDFIHKECPEYVTRTVQTKLSHLQE
jgi:hypothetical protein